MRMVITENNKTVNEKTVKRETRRIGVLLLACLVYDFGINCFIVPAGLYTGGILGLAQLIRSFLEESFHLSFGSFDIAGLIYYAINVPFLIIAYGLMGKLYFIKTILAITAESVFLLVIPIPAKPLVTDVFASGIIGSLICGAMMGLILRMGACDGGMDLIGVLLVHKQSRISVGNANLYVNILVFTIMAIKYPLQVMIYSLAGSYLMSLALDHFFTQNINVEFHIVTGLEPEILENEIQSELSRSVTRWRAVGTYSGAGKNLLYVIVDKYEAPRLRRLIREFDPKAFVVENQNVTIDGFFEKHLE